MKAKLPYNFVFCMLLGGLFLLSIPVQAMQNERQAIKKEFIQILSSYSTSPERLEKAWSEIEKIYTEERRTYHNMEHLENFYSQLQKVKDRIHDYESVFMAMIYHDIVYFTSSNEMLSAEKATEDLNFFQFPKDKISRVESLILATQNHSLSPDSDTNYFLDADLSILGLSPEKYDAYTKGILGEYGAGKTFLQGRKRFLQRYLQKETLYMTEYFQNLYEKTARQNIEREILKIG